MLDFKFSEQAEREFLALEKELQGHFMKHINKLRAMPPRRHLRSGLDHFVENVTKQARFAYDIIDDKLLFIARCFATHKEYERWFKSFK